MNADPMKEERFANNSNIPGGYFGADEWKDQG